MIKLFCDICGKEESILYKYTIPGHTLKESTAHGHSVIVFEQPTDIEIEICAKCQEKIRKMLHIVK